MTADAADRLVALETRLAHHERMAEEISEVLSRQTKTIDALVAQVRLLQDRLADMAEEWRRSPQDDRPPPHY
ncbi:MAG TPA: SlyX family protein [Rhodospirillaceae bacterium]|nr:SlyX family protein [Rhodospirillaceae bacterium]